jgi:hypothetical protein
MRLCIRYIIPKYNTKVVITNIKPEYNTFFFEPTETRYVSKKINTQNIHGLIPSTNHKIIKNTIGQTDLIEISFHKNLTV